LLQPTCNHNHKLLASGSAEINPVDSGDINISQTWKSRDRQLGKKSEIWLRKAVDKDPYYRNNQPSVLTSTPKCRRR